MGARISVSVHLETWEEDATPSFEAEISGNASAKRRVKSLSFENSGSTPGDLLAESLAEISDFVSPTKVVGN